MDITQASGPMKSSLDLLLAAVGLLLLIACVNVANLQLARMTARSREIAMRSAIGAGRGRLVRQLLTESVILSLLGGALGVLFSFALVQAIVALIPPDSVPNEARIIVNGYVLLFSLAVSMLTGILFGIVPALRSSHPDLAGAVKDGGNGTGGSIRGQATRSGLVVVEIALSVILLTGASLAIRSFVNLLRTDPGFIGKKPCPCMWTCNQIGIQRWNSATPLTGNLLRTSRSWRAFRPLPSETEECPIADGNPPMRSRGNRVSTARRWWSHSSATTICALLGFL
jgi:hypothetical protein